MIISEVSALARLTFYENLLTGQEMCLLFLSVLSGLNVDKMYCLSPGTKKTFRNNGVSVLSKCLQSGVRLY